MATNYLYNKYKGKYRVLADYDLDTNDFPRDDSGNIDPDFNDFYIPGKKGVQIRHSYRDILGCYALGTSAKLGNNILKQIYTKEFNKEPTEYKSTDKTMTRIEIELIKASIIIEVTHYDDGILFTFNSKHLDDWANIFKLKTSGANISPLSSKNLPKSDYKIPSKDENKYKELLPKNMDNIKKAQAVKKATKTIQSKFNKKQENEMKKLCMKPRQYIHYINMWEDWLTEISKELKNI